MNPDHSRTMRRPPARPLPPARTLRGDSHPRPGPAGAWAAPVRSGIGERQPVPPQPPAETASDSVPGLQPLAQPLTGQAPSLPTGTWTDSAPDEAAAELVLEDEVWVSDADLVLEEMQHGQSIEPLEGLTLAGDVARTEPQAAPDEPPVGAWDFPVARPPAETGEHPKEERSGWEVLSRAFSESTPTREPGEEPATEPLESAEPGILSAAEGAAADASDEGDPADLARRLERLADRLRMHGTHALEESRLASDPMEAAVAAALAGLLAKRED